MNTKKYLLASVSAFIVMYLLSWLGYELILPMLFSADPLEPIYRSEQLMIGIMAAYLITALIMSYIYPKGVEGDNVMGNGLRFGALIGLLVSLPIALIFYSIIEGYQFSDVVVETLWHVIEKGIGGIVIAYVFGKS